MATGAIVSGSFWLATRFRHQSPDDRTVLLFDPGRGLADDLVPDKGQFRQRFHQPLSYCCPATIFRDILAAVFGRLRVAA